MLSTLYAAATRWRRQATPRHRLARPVISVGNLAMGGRAKTPMAEAVARTLLAAGERPAILSRGYGRQSVVDQPVVVRDAHAVRAGLAEAGDEPLMLADRLDGAIVVVHGDRGRAGAIAEQLGATVHVLDDGFQHLQLARDIDIVMLHPADLNGEVPPVGRLREPIDALDYADAIVVIDDDEEERRLTAEGLEGLRAHVFTSTRRVSSPPSDLAGLSCLFVSGIADAQQALDTIRAAGWQVTRARRFKDHHRYSASDADGISREAVAAGVSFVLTTAKDAVRLREVWTSPLPLHVAELSLAIDDRPVFDRWLIERITRARALRTESERTRRRDGSRRAS